jgi:hypothetical protein
MRNFKIAAAIAAVCAGDSAYALPPTATYDIELVVAGASAQRDTFRQEFAAICQAATLNNYQAQSTPSVDFRAYSCTLNTSGLPASIAGRNAIVYYRSEGGSVYGVGPLAKNQQVKRLLVNGSCSVATQPAFGNCPVTGYALSTDLFTSGNLTNSLVDLGVSDVEPRRFVGENWPPVSALGPQPTNTQFSSVNSQTATGTVFGILANSSVPFNDLSRQDINSIFTGQYGDWNQVGPTGNGSPAASQVIPVCRREQGSGTQVSASIYFNGQGCPVGYAFVTAPNNPNFENPVIEASTSSAMNNCVVNNAGSIGIQTYTTSNPAGTKWLSINGVAPSKVAAALGDYDFWMESTFNKDEVIAAKPLPLALADTLITRARNAASIPVNDSVFALYNGGINTPTLPVATDRPVALATKSGNSCLPANGVF